MLPPPGMPTEAQPAVLAQVQTGKWKELTLNGRARESTINSPMSDTADNSEGQFTQLSKGSHQDKAPGTQSDDQLIKLFLCPLMKGIGEGNGTPLQYSSLENPMDGGAWWAAVHGVTEGRTRLSDFTFTFHFHALEKEMATHSSVLAWRIPGMGCCLWCCTESDTTEAT